MHPPVVAMCHDDETIRIEVKITAFTPWTNSITNVSDERPNVFVLDTLQEMGPAFEADVLTCLLFALALGEFHFSFDRG